MLLNPPYGKSWKGDLERAWAARKASRTRHDRTRRRRRYSMLTHSSDGQMLFLASMLSKMKKSSKLGGRIAEVHNGSSLFTGDTGQGESNIRRWIIENDWLEAIVALPLNMFYRHGHCDLRHKVLSNRKAPHRKARCS
ncbi:MAG: N-6 DNA methylase [Candidatus Eisenbacteria bacterium]